MPASRELLDNKVVVLRLLRAAVLFYDSSRVALVAQAQLRAREVPQRLRTKNTAPCPAHRDGDARRVPAAPDLKEAPPLERVLGRLLRRPLAEPPAAHPPEPLGRHVHLCHELRGGLGPHEVVRVDRGAVALRARGLFVDSITETQSTQSLGAAVASTGLGLRFGWRRIDLVLPPENIGCCVRTGSSVTNSQTTTKRPATS